MFPAASLVTTLLLTLSIVATPLEVRTTRVTLPFAKRISANGGAINLVKHDQARAATLKDRGSAIQNGKLDRRDGGIAITNEAVSYVAAVGVGDPATIYNLFVDTGSSNTWVGAGTPYTPTSTSVNTGEPVSVSGSFSGEEWLDTVSLYSGLTITGQSIGVASTSSGYSGVDGVLGLGPESLTEGTLTDEPDTLIPTVTQNLYTEGTISEEVVGFFFAPTTTEPSTNGELIFGGTDPSGETGSISYVPLTTTSPSSLFWGINQSITYGSDTVLGETAGIVDTGTTLILIASNAYSAYQSATGATLDDNTGLLQLTTTQYDALQNLNFNIGSVAYALIPNGQIWPRSLNTYIGGTTDAIYSIVNDLGSPSGEGLDFINGQAFLERFYCVFDSTNHRIGFATTNYTDATTN
ncbi:aspartic proteinase [Boletus edulis]|uniref:Aspartic peptidase domain-containing protein n=1 Tax=Boletus edulis BED1 TaxID=1328754 RepID=A0AAD4GB41_BOLED|nr:aspartic proteinase [Boletus edulis]KAF8434734.1 aspartic peptidase domain-containing protein [Boletus edulis BED1]